MMKKIVNNTVQKKKKSKTLQTQQTPQWRPLKRELQALHPHTPTRVVSSNSPGQGKAIGDVAGRLLGLPVMGVTTQLRGSCLL